MIHISLSLADNLVLTDSKFGGTPYSANYQYLCPRKILKMSKSLIPKLKAIKQRYNEVADLIIQPNVISDQKKYSQLNKEYSDLGKIVRVYDEYKQALDTISESDEIIADGSDKDLVDLAKMEKQEALAKIPQFEEDLKYLLIPKDPADDKNVIVELRAGTREDEAS